MFFSVGHTRTVQVPYAHSHSAGFGNTRILYKWRCNQEWQFNGADTVIDLLTRRLRFDSDARRLTLKDTNQGFVLLNFYCNKNAIIAISQ